MSEKNYDSVSSTEELSTLIEKLINDHKTVAYDIETGYHGPDRKRGALIPGFSIIVGISFTNSLNWARYAPISHDLSENLDSVESARLFWTLFNNTNTIAHNASFELTMLSRWFLELLSDDPIFGEAVRTANGYYPCFSDTMIESYIRAETKLHGLKAITLDNFDYQMVKILELFPDLPKNKEAMIRFNVLELEPHVVKYACEDSVWCLANHERNHPVVKDKFLFKIEMECISAVIGMEDCGAAFDWKFLRDASELGHEFLAELDAEIQKELSSLTGDTVTINLNSPMQVQKILFEKLNMTTTRYTKSSMDKVRDGILEKDGTLATLKMSTDKIALAGLSKQYPVVKKLLIWKNIKKLLTSYLDKYEKEFKSSDGRIHAGFNQAALPAGRFSCNNPNLQQLPKEYDLKTDSGMEFKLNFRNAVIAPEDWYIIGFDYATQETRILAGESQEQYLFDAFARGIDIHIATAAMLFNKAVTEVHKKSKERSIGKTFNFALTYGLSIQSMSERLAITFEEAEALYNKFFESYSSVDAWMDGRKRYGKEHGYIISKFGRKIPIWEFSDPRWKVRNKGERISVNAAIQGAGADYVKTAMVLSRRALIKAGLQDKVKLFLNVHDALEFYAHKSVDPAVVIKLLTPTVSFPVDGWPEMRVDWHIGQRWGSVEDVALMPDGTIKVVREDEDDKIEISEEEIEDGEMSPVDLTKLGRDTWDIVFEETPSSAVLSEVIDRLKKHPGIYKVTLIVNDRKVELPIRTSLSHEEYMNTYMNVLVGGTSEN